MAEINNADSVRLWLRQCPAVNQKKRFSADYMGENATEYSLLSIPSQLRTRENILGEEVPLDEQEQSFMFATKLPYGADITQELENLAFFQDVTNWLYEQNAAKNFPDWDGGRIKSIVPTLTPTISRVSADAAEYRIQIKVTYRRN